MAVTLNFPKSYRLLCSRDFEYLKQGSIRLSTPWMRIYYKNSRILSDKTRIGYSVSKKVGNAVIRNRIKRLIREDFRRWQIGRNLGLDILIIVSPNVIKKFTSMQDIESAILSSFCSLKQQILKRQFKGKHEVL